MRYSTNCMGDWQTMSRMWHPSAIAHLFCCRLHVSTPQIAAIIGSKIRETVIEHGKGQKTLDSHSRTTSQAARLTFFHRLPFSKIYILAEIFFLMSHVELDKLKLSMRESSLGVSSIEVLDTERHGSRSLPALRRYASAGITFSLCQMGPWPLSGSAAVHIRRYRFYFTWPYQ